VCRQTERPEPRGDAPASRRQRCHKIVVAKTLKGRQNGRPLPGPFDMATTSTFGTTARKAIARLAVIGLDDKSGELLRDCFRQFGVSTTAVADDPSHRFLKEKFEACVLRLDDGAEPILEQIRSSPSNKRIVIYGISKGTQAAMRYSKY